MKTTYLVVLLAVVLAVPTVSWAHCDSVAGPVARDVKLALESGHVSPVLKWIRAADEPELRAVFNRAISVRGSGAEAATAGSLSPPKRMTYSQALQPLAM